MIDRPFRVPRFREKRRALEGLARVDGARVLDVLADAYGGRVVLFADHELALGNAVPDRLTYDELRSAGARVAGALRGAGLRDGDAVGILTRNGPELVVGTLGALRAGLAAAPLNPKLTPAEIDSALERVDARTIVADGTTAEALRATSAELVLRLDGDEVAAAAEAPPARVEASDTALVFFTSGTTGEPKAATIPHRAVGSILRRYLRVASFLPTPRSHLVLLVMPLAHTAGLITFLTTSCLAAPSLVLERFDARSALEAIEEARPTVFAGSPAMYELLFREGAEGYDLSSIRVWGGGADVFHRDLLDRLRELGGWRRLGMRFKPFTVIGYGSSETTGPVTISPPVPVGERCVGWVLPSFEHRIVDESGGDVRPGETGELLLRGRSLMSGYLEEPGGSGHDDAGWFRTGDLVRKGRLGMLHYEGRHKDVITSGGYTIAAREIEAALESHPRVARAAALGLEDRIRGERAVAVVVLTDGPRGPSPEALHSWAAERLAAYKRPREIYVADEIPLTSNLKPRKGQLRDMLATREESPPEPPR